VVLVRVERAGRLLHDPLGRLVVAARIIRLDGGRADDDARAERAQPRHLFLRHLVGHHEHAGIAAQRRDQRQPHARVAAGRLDDRSARPQQAATLGVLHDVARHPVLHGTARVQVLALHEDLRADVAGDLLQLHDRRSPDRLQDVALGARHGAPPFRT